MYERAIKLYEQHLGIQHPRVTEILQNMAKLYLDAVSINLLHELATVIPNAINEANVNFNSIQYLFYAILYTYIQAPLRRDASTKQ